MTEKFNNLVKINHYMQILKYRGGSDILVEEASNAKTCELTEDQNGNPILIDGWIYLIPVNDDYHPWVVGFDPTSAGYEGVSIDNDFYEEGSFDMLGAVKKAWELITDQMISLAYEHIESLEDPLDITEEA